MIKIKLIKTCWDCEYRHHTGSHAAQPKFVCQHEDVSERNKVDAEYWYSYPILGRASVRNRLDIPSWCPLEDYKG